MTSLSLSPSPVPQGTFRSREIETFGASVPIRLRYYLQSDPDVQNLDLHNFLSVVDQSVRQCRSGAGHVLGPAACPVAGVASSQKSICVGAFGVSTAAAAGASDCAPMLSFSDSTVA